MTLIRKESLHSSVWPVFPSELLLSKQNETNQHLLLRCIIGQLSLILPFQGFLKCVNLWPLSSEKQFVSNQTKPLEVVEILYRGYMQYAFRIQLFPNAIRTLPVHYYARHPAAGNCFQNTTYPAVWNSPSSPLNCRSLRRNVKRY